MMWGDVGVLIDHPGCLSGTRLGPVLFAQLRPAGCPVVNEQPACT